jgi:hypothetical protein
VAEANAGQIRVIDPPYDGPGRALSLIPDEPGLSQPIGLCSWPGGVLAADAKENLVMQINSNGQSRILIDAIGRGPGQIRCPTTLYRDEATPTGFWLVDKLNHRLQHFDSGWNVTQQVGRLGLGRGELFNPCGAGIFNDRMLLVSQQGDPWALKLFGEFGEETGSLLLDYCPTGILVQAHRVFVAEIYGNAVRIYERA